MLEVNVLDNNLHPVEPLYTKRGSWIKYFGHSNSLYVRVIKAIINHTPIGEYHLYFFSNKDFSCLCGDYPIESRHHILHNYRRFNNY